MAFPIFIKLVFIFTSFLLIQKSLGIALETGRAQQLGTPQINGPAPVRNNSSARPFVRTKRDDINHWNRILSMFNWPPLEVVDHTKKLEVAFVFNRRQAASSSYQQKFDEEFKLYFGENAYKPRKDGSIKGYCAEWGEIRENYRPFCVVANARIGILIEFISMNAWLVDGIDSEKIEPPLRKTFAAVMESNILPRLMTKLGKDMAERVEIMFAEGLKKRSIQKRPNKRSATATGYPNFSAHGLSPEGTKAHLEPILQKREPVMITESTFDVRFLTTPPLTTNERVRLGITSNGVPEKAWLEESQGEGVNIYLLNSGFFEEAKDHPEFSETVGSEGRIKGWLHHPLLGQEGTDFYATAMIDKPPSGTCTLSKILGRRGGLAKKANVWIVPYPEDGWALWPTLVYLDQIMAIRRHILNRRKEDPTHKAIIHLGANIFEYRTEQEQEIYYWDDEELQFTKNEKLWIGRVSSLADEALQSLLMLENTIIVTDAGIWKKGIPIVTWPAIHGPLFKSLVVVGSVDTAGNLAFHREEDFVKVYAIGYGVEVPFFRRRNDFSVLQNGYESAKDSRHAAAAIVGILATHLSSNKDWDTTAAVDKLYNDAYSRVRNGPKVAWTGVRPPTAGCKRQREDEDGEEGDKKVKLEDSECSGDQIQS